MMKKIPDGSIEILKVLQDDELYTIEGINQKLPEISINTIRYAIRRLMETGLVVSIPDLEDMRTVKYQIVPETKIHSVIEELPDDIANTLREKLI